MARDNVDLLDTVGTLLFGFVTLCGASSMNFTLTYYSTLVQGVVD